jgi:hypothetical protein
MIKHCLIHFGFPKTGTTSIQRFLRHELSDSDFCYPAFSTSGGVSDDCHNRALNWAFRSAPEKFHLQAKERTPLEVIHRLGNRFREQIRREVQSSSAQTLILSAEELCWFTTDDLTRMIHFLGDLGLAPSAFAYIRRFKEYQESHFQQGLREPGALNMATPKQPGSFRGHYRRPILSFDSLLGKSNVTVSMFEPREFKDGCVVRDFCGKLNIKTASVPGRLLNESLSFEALKLLYAYRLHGPGYGEGPGAMESNRLLVGKLAELKGSHLVFHSSLLTSNEDKWRADVEWAMERTGFDLIGNILEDDDKPCVSCAEDMLRFSPESLDWLARAANVQPSTLASADPRVVAATVDILHKQLARRSLRGRLGNFVKRWF